MTAKIITARRFLDRLSFVVHLDTTKLDTLDPTKPDPRWLLSRDWPIPPNWAGRTAAERTAIMDGIKVELVSASSDRLAVLQEEDAGGTVLPMEGTTFG